MAPEEGRAGDGVEPEVLGGGQDRGTGLGEKWEVWRNWEVRLVRMW